MVGIFKNITIIAVAFDFCTGPVYDHVDLGCDHTGPGWDIGSGYILVVFFNLDQF